MISAIGATIVFIYIWQRTILGIRFSIYAHAFNGMRMEEAKKIYQVQSWWNKITMLYLIDCNPTPYQAKSRIIWELVCSAIFTISTISVIVISWIEILINWRFPLLRFLGAIFLLAPLVAMFGATLFPLPQPPEKDVIQHKKSVKKSIYDTRGESLLYIWFPSFFRDYRVDGRHGQK